MGVKLINVREDNLVSSVALMRETLENEENEAIDAE